MVSDLQHRSVVLFSSATQHWDNCFLPDRPETASKQEAGMLGGSFRGCCCLGGPIAAKVCALT